MTKEYSGIRAGTEATIIIKSANFLPYQQRLSRLELWKSLEEKKLRGIHLKSLVIIINGRRRTACNYSEFYRQN